MEANLTAAFAAYQGKAPNVAGYGSKTSQQDKERMLTKAKEFESFYISQFINTMMPEVDPDSMFSGGTGEQFFRQSLNEQIAKNISDRGGFGLSGRVYAELLKAQEEGRAVTSSF